MNQRFVIFWLLCGLSVRIPLAFPEEPAAREALHEEGNRLKQNGALKEALSKYQESLRLAIQAADQRAAANNWIEIAEINRALADYAAALTAAENAGKIGEILADKQILCKAQLLSARLDNNRNHYDQALEKSAVARKLAEELRDNTLLANSLHVRAEALLFQGNFDQAFESLQNALSLAEQSRDPQTLCSVLDKLGELFRKRGSLSESTSYHERAVKIAEENGLKLLLPGVLNSLALVYKDQGLTEEASLTHVRALDAAEAIEDKLTSAKTLNNLGIIYWEKGAYDKATYYLHRASRLAQELGNQYGIAKVLHNLAMVYQTQGMDEKALTYYKRALKIRLDLGTKDEIPSALSNIGDVYADQNKTGEAISYQRRALALATKIGDKLRMAYSALGLGEIYSRHGSPQKAEFYFNKSYTIAAEMNSRKVMALALKGLAQVYLDQRNFTASLDAFQRSLALAEEIQAPRIISKSQQGLGETYAEMGDTRRAIEMYTTAINEIENIRISATSEEGKAGVLADQMSLYEELIALLYKSRDPVQRRAAFGYSERAKARALLDSLAEAQAGIRKGLSTQQFLQERGIFKKISTIQSQLSTANPAESELGSLKAELKKAEEELEKFLLDLRLSNPEYARLQYPQPDNLEAVQSELDRDTLLVEFFLGGRQSFVFAVSRDNFQMEVLPARQDLQQDLDLYRRLAGNPLKSSANQDAQTVFEQYHRQSQILFNRLLSPIHSSLKGTQKILFVLDGILHYVPFEALEDKSLQPEGGRGKYLIEDHVISYVPSASVWRNLRRNVTGTERRKELLAFGDPVFQSSHDLSLNKGATTEQPEIDHIRGLYEGRGFYFDPLPYSRLEVERISTLFPKERQQVYLGEQATESILKKERLDSYKAIHFATHAVIDEQVPGRSGVVLSSPDPEEDGVLQIHEIFNLELNADLVILSACQTALGKLVYGEGIVGLTRAFLYAGTSNIVVSLWNVDDKSTADLMAGFYESMKSGRDKAFALREAKLELLKAAETGSQYPAYAHPYYWAAFTLVGAGQ